MINHNDIGRRRCPPRFDDMAVLVITTFLTETVLRGRGNGRPQMRGFRNAANLRNVTGAGSRCPRTDLLQITAAFGKQAVRGTTGLLQSVQAQIIRAAFKQRCLGTDAQGVAYQRQIAMKQLVLQIAGAGRYDYPAPR